MTGNNNLFEFNRGVLGGGVVTVASSAVRSSLSNSRFSFNNIGCLGCPAQKEHVFSICLDNNQRVADGQDVLLLQPCRGTACAYVQCWGLEYVAWDAGCQLEAGGWRASGKHACGASSYPWVNFMMPQVHWQMVSEEAAAAALA